MPIINTVIAGGGTTPTGTITITSNGITDVTNYATADVQVPTTAPALYRELQNENGNLVGNKTTTHKIDFTGITHISGWILCRAYDGNTAISGTIDMSDVELVDGNGLEYAYYGCSGITSLDLTSLKYWNYGGGYTFSYSGLTSAGLPNVEYIAGAYDLFRNTKLTTISFPKCHTLVECYSMFMDVTTLVSADLSNVVNIEWAGSLFYGDTSLTTVDLSFLAVISDTNAMFYGCTALTSLSFPAFAPLAQHYVDYPASLNEAFLNIPNITLHFPSNVQSIVEGLDGYSATAPFGATAGSVLFDLPATYALDASGTPFVRCPSKDTASALAWIVPAGYFIYWTAGTTQPSVDDWVYSDENLTQQYMQISSILQ